MMNSAVISDLINRNVQQTFFAMNLEKNAGSDGVFSCVTLLVETLRNANISRHFHSQSLISKEGNPCQGLGSSAGSPTLTESEEGHEVPTEQQGCSHPAHLSPFLVLCGED